MQSIGDVQNLLYPKLLASAILERRIDDTRHVAGATVTHTSPFSDLEVPTLTEPLERDFCEKWVVPFYRASLFRGAEEFAVSLRPIYAEISPELIVTLLSDFNWRPRITAAYFAAIRRERSVQHHIGKLLLRSDVCYAGGGYCLALARFGGAEAVDYLSQYLTYYLSQPHLWFDQGDAIGALNCIDRNDGSHYVNSFRDKWNVFASDKSGWTIDRCIERFDVQLEAIQYIESQMSQ